MNTTILDTQPDERPNVLRRALNLIGEYKRAYATINILYYGLVILGMIYVATNPDLQKALLEAVQQSFGEGSPLESVGAAYGGGKILEAMALTFVVNLVVGTVLYITLPSLIVPFSGLLMGIYRATLWGLLLSPADPSLTWAMIPHSLTLILEGQAYIVAMLAVFIHGKAIFRPQSVGAETWRRGYVEGLKRTGQLYLLVVILLAIAAIYEALEVILLAPLFA